MITYSFEASTGAAWMNELPICIKCNVNFVIYKKKQLCRGCYQKAYRETEVGKAKVLLYNNSEKGKSSRRKYEKQKSIKERQIKAKKFVLENFNKNEQ